MGPDGAWHGPLVTEITIVWDRLGDLFASMNEVKNILPGIDQVIIYLVAVVVLLTMPRGLMGRKGVMER